MSAPLAFLSDATPLGPPPVTIPGWVIVGLILPLTLFCASQIVLIRREARHRQESTDRDMRRLLDQVIPESGGLSLLEKLTTIGAQIGETTRRLNEHIAQADRDRGEVWAVIRGRRRDE